MNLFVHVKSFTMSMNKILLLEIPHSLFRSKNKPLQQSTHSDVHTEGWWTKSQIFIVKQNWKYLFC